MIVKTQISEPHQFRVSKSVGLGKHPQICIFNKFPSDAEAAGLEPHFENLYETRGQGQAQFVKRMAQPLRTGFTKTWLELIRSKMTKD